tara:strand:+ start:110235 stop:111089 length:855 start_codon:yes stop_codon:yes gene_type:complete
MKAWRSFEQDIFGELKVRYKDAEVLHDVKLEGRLSDVKRQADIVLRRKKFGREIVTVFEAKFYSKKVDVKDVDSFVGFLDDVGADQGVLYTNVGFSDAAKRRAEAASPRIEVDIYPLFEYAPFQAECAIPYHGDRGVVVLAPIGWVVDGRNYGRGQPPCYLYRRGQTLEKATTSGVVAYLQFWKKDDTAKSIEELIDFQTTRLTQHYGGDCDAEIAYDLGACGQRISVRDTKLPNGMREVAGYSEFEDFICFSVLVDLGGYSFRPVTKMQELIGSILPVHMRHE